MNSVLRHDMLQMYLDKAGRIISRENPTEHDFNELSSLTDQVLSWNDVILTLQYAKIVSNICEDKHRPFIKLDSLQKSIIKSCDDELMYTFATEVQGADIKEILKNMYGKMYPKLKKELTPLDELVK